MALSRGRLVSLDVLAIIRFVYLIVCDDLADEEFSTSVEQIFLTYYWSFVRNEADKKLCRCFF